MGKNSVLKKIGRQILPKKFRNFLWGIIPRFYLVNTYLLKRKEFIGNLISIDSNFIIREVSWSDEAELIKAHEVRGPKSYKKVPPRLNSPEWHGLAVFDTNTGDIAYIAWVIDKNIPYFEDFGIKMRTDQFLLKDGFCIPAYRHKGLHTRMEQERINYCIRNGAKEIFIQIHDSNIKGKHSVTNNGYELVKKSWVISWPLFFVFRNLNAFFKNPFKKVIQ